MSKEKIQKKIDHLMEDEENEIDEAGVSWRKYDKHTKFSFDVDEVYYKIDDDLINSMKNYVELRKKYPNVKQTKHDDVNNIIKIYKMYDNDNFIYATTKGSIMRAIKNTLYGFFSGEKNTNFSKFDSPFGISVRLIGYIKGTASKTVKEFIINEYIEQHNDEKEYFESKTNSKSKSKITKQNSGTNLSKDETDISTNTKQKNNPKPKISKNDNDKFVKISTKTKNKNIQNVENISNELETIPVCDVDGEDGNKNEEKNSKKKIVKYSIQVKKMCSKLFEYLDINETHIGTNAGVFLIKDVSEENKNNIANMKDECKQYFNTRNWCVFGKTKVKNEWLSLTKNILKACDYKVYAVVVHISKENQESGYYIKK